LHISVKSVILFKSRLHNKACVIFGQSRTAFSTSLISKIA